MPVAPVVTRRAEAALPVLGAWLVLVSAMSTTFALDGGAAAANGGVPQAPALRGGRLAELWTGLEVRDLQGRVWTADDFEGRIVLLDFWATWCAPCLADFPRLKQARAAYVDRGLVILGVSLDRRSRRDLRSFARRHGVSWPVHFDGLGAGGAVARRFGVEYPPRSLLFDRRGRLVAVDARGATLDAALRALFAVE